MSVPYQSGIIAEPNSDALFLLFNQSNAPEGDAQIKTFLSTFPETFDAAKARFGAANLHLTIAIGSGYWERLSPTERPALLRQLPAYENGIRVAPSTPMDLMFIVRGDRYDACFDVANMIHKGLSGAAQLVEEVHGFRYLDSRDMTGFVDGTENPQGEHRQEVAIVGEEDPAFAGGSYVHLQRYEHNLDAWNRLPVKAQEDAYGRSKADNVEYAGAEKSPHAHTRRASLKTPEGESIEILRQSMPYGDTQRKGLMFISCCRTPENFEQILKSMVYGDEKGQADRILEFTRAVQGAAFFAPAVEWFKKLA